MNVDGSTPICPQGLDHVTIIVNDLERTSEFYVQRLGLKQVERPDFDFPGLWFQAGSTQIHATQASEFSGQAGPGPRASSSVSRGQHFAFRIQDLDRALEFLHSSGVEIADGPKFRPDGVRQVYLKDPDGYTVELFCDSR